MIDSFFMVLVVQIIIPIRGVVNHASSSETFFLIDEAGIEHLSSSSLDVPKSK